MKSESWTLESEIQFKESRITLTSGIQNLSSKNKDWNPVPGIPNRRRGVQNRRLYHWISFFNMPPCTFILSVPVMFLFLLHSSKNRTEFRWLHVSFISPLSFRNIKQYKFYLLLKYRIFLIKRQPPNTASGFPHKEVKNKRLRYHTFVHYRLKGKYSWISIQRPPFGQKKVAIVKRWPLLRGWNKRKNGRCSGGSTVYDS